MRLSDYLSQHNLKHREFAERIGVSQAAVTRYAKGHRVPRPGEMRAIIDATRGEVTPNDFLAAAPSDQREAAE